MAKPRLVPLPAFEEFENLRDPNHPAYGSDRCIFLDRDGVVNKRRLLLVRRWSHFRFVTGVERALARLARLPVYIVVVTNQDAVGTGYIEHTEMSYLHREMVNAVRAVGGRIDALYACVHPRWQPCECAKPRPGMLQAAGARYGLDPKKCWIIGDNAKDMHAGRAFGCRTVLVDPRLRTWAQRARSAADEVYVATPVALTSVAERLEEELGVAAKPR